MNRYNLLLNSHFKGCRELVTVEDASRKRVMRVYLLAGVESLVGISDGVDSWIAPVLTSFKDLNLTKLIEESKQKRERRKLIEQDEREIKPRRKLCLEKN